MNELLMRILRRILLHLEQSSLEVGIEGKTPEGVPPTEIIRKNSHFMRIVSAIVISGLYLISLYVLYETTTDYSQSSVYYYKLFGSVFFFLFQSLLFINFFSLIRANNRKIITYFYLIYFPLFYASFFLLDSGLELAKERGYTSLMINALIAVYPLMYILRSYFPSFDHRYITFVKNIFLSYNLGFFFLLAISTVFITLGYQFDLIPPLTTIIALITEGIGNESFGFFYGMLILTFCFILLTLGVFSLNLYFEESGKSHKRLHIGILLILCVFVSPFFSAILDNYYDSQIQKAARILSAQGQNADSYDNAHVLFLERALLSKIKNGGYYDRALFSQLYDSTPEAYFGEKIAKYTESRSSFATNASKVGDEASVSLSLVEIENNMSQGSKFPVLETTYRFNLQNSTTTNQEVIINFEAPTKYSVISGLKLGLDLQLIGQIAPRGAARKVYENSLRRNTDPALIEKIGLNTYTLRVFPVPSKQDQKTQGRQLVELKILTPILNKKETVTYAPKFSFINLKFDEESSLKSKVYDESTLVKEDIVKNSGIEKYLKSEHTLDLDADSNFDVGEFCINGLFPGEGEPSLAFDSSKRAPLNKVSLFFDNSLSAKRNGANEYYDDIYKKIKNFGDTLHDVDVYTANFDVNKVGDTSDIKFWGYSDTDRIIEYIINNNISNNRIILVTDDDDFNFSTIENKAHNYSSLVTNQISIIKIGNGVKSYKQEINNILASTNGNIYEVDETEDIERTIEKIFGLSDTESPLSVCSETSSDEVYNKIQGGYVSNKLLNEINDESDWQNIAEIQTSIATEFGIVNQFNSLIALENERQQRELDSYKESTTKYETSFNNNEAVGTPSVGFQDWSDRNTMFDARPMMDMRSDSIGLKVGMNSSLMGASRGGIVPYSSSSYYDRGSSFNGKVEFSFFGLLMFLIYLAEGYAFIAFIMSYIRSYKKQK